MLGTVYRNKDYQGRIERAREQFHCGFEVNEEMLSPLVLESWQRSRQFNVSSNLSRAPEIEGNGLTNTEQDSYLALRKAALPVIKDARRILDDNQLLMLLTSAEGKIIEREGNLRSLKIADSQQLIIGSSWTESSCGTNAVGMAISLQQPAQIVAHEHYCEMVKVWGCAAVPIKDLRDGRMLGVLDTTGPAHSFGSMNLGWVNSMASCIAFRLNEERNLSKYRLLEHCMGQARRLSQANVQLFDEDGFLVWMSDWLLTKQCDVTLLGHNQIGMRWDEMAVSRQPLKNPPRDIQADCLEPVVIGGRIAGHLLFIPVKVEKKVTKIAVIEARQSSLIIGESAVTEGLKNLAKRFACVDAICTLTGETGTGKEVMAREMHALGNREGAFIAVNCGAMQKELLASELFGYAEGSFTGAKRGGMIGKFEAANGGTLLLDEFCELPLELQVYLLRVLEEHEVVRIGESKPRKINVRIIVATNKNLEEEVEAKRLREDLYYRINANMIELPPLREHKEDIMVLFDHFLGRVSSESCGIAPQLTPSFIKALKAHSWPGNIRELRNFAENCFLMNPGETLTVEHLPNRMLASVSRSSGQEESACGCTLKEVERQALVEALSLFDGNISKAARHLGIARSTFYKKMDALEKD
ncbi:MAG: hypothetical protein DRQ61_00180 [Gammaproteobacteria bacterium]|nr:MAG: hypothetical protein DRQ56_01540 [Gammaproteobacteria bacterium]RLA24708.1 MAG: hypothetical protein DRQ61_00180 [Gammaproteobacteria bacterium]